MKRIVLLIFIVTFSFFNSFSQEAIGRYKKAIPFIVNSEFFSDSNKCPHYMVLGNVIPFEQYAVYFKTEIESLGYEGDYILSANNTQTIGGLSNVGCRKSKNKIQFSEFNGDLFFAEYFTTAKKKHVKLTTPMFGPSYLYLYRVNESVVSLIGVKELHNN